MESRDEFGFCIPNLCTFWPASSRSASAGGEFLQLHMACIFTSPAASHGLHRGLQLHMASHVACCNCRAEFLHFHMYHAAGGAGEAGLATWVGWCREILVSPHEVSQRWHTEQRCSYQHVGETFEPEQNWHQSPNNGVMDLNIEWSTWESRTEPIRHVVGSSSSSNPWEEPIYNYPTVGETTYEHTQVSSSEPRNVFEQSPVQTNFGASSSSYAFHDDDVYRPQFDYPQPSTYGQSMGVDSVTCWLSTTTISTPSFAQDMYSTPPPMQTMDDQLNQDEQTPDLLHQRRMVNPPRRYDQTSSLHRQVLPRRKG
ncbi:hypothetical protein V6N12_061916 [Hibiscus sabdariffa]|uniref:Uncharacterized protein n=1 Tax=Hibiscus sabdariffa TaxID=183260 RepID=A0ABR2DYG6_9ROSI